MSFKQVPLLCGVLLLLVLSSCKKKPPKIIEKSSTSKKGTVVQLESCYDGDTCDFTDFEKSVRFARIDTPEKDGACRESALKARSALLNQLHEAGTIRVVPKGEGYYGRIIGEVYADGINLNDWMLRKDHAVKYGKDTCANDE